MKHKILFVDDEINVVKGIKRIFLNTDYQVFIETDCDKALDIMKQNRISVLVSDMRMPVMDGVKFIKLANEIDPTTIKLILSGYSDIEDIMSAVNEGHIYSYITKPWHDSNLKLVIGNACRYYESIINEKLLIKKLKVKQKELLDLNKNLESIVEDRTREIKETNILLNHIISGMPEDEFLQKTAKILSGALSGRNTAIWNARDKQIYKSNSLFVFDSTLVDRAGDAGNPVTHKNLIITPIMKKSRLLGALIIEKPDKDSKYILNRIDNLLSAVNLYLSQQLLIDDSSSVISSIDNLIGEIDNA